MNNVWWKIFVIIGTWNYFLYDNQNIPSHRLYIDGLMQDCSISIACALEILQSCTKPSICRCICCMISTQDYLYSMEGCPAQWVLQHAEYIENDVCTRMTNCFSAHEWYFGVYFRSCEWAHKQFVTRVHTLFYFLHDIMNPFMTIKPTIFTHRPCVSLAQFSVCWWRHNQFLMMSQWSDNCDMITCIVISNSVDIDFTHGDI